MIDLTRRSGLLRLMAVGFCVLLASCLTTCKKFREPYTFPEKSFEIRQLILRGKNPQENRQFWTEELGLELLQSNNQSFLVKLGTSRLGFNPAIIYPGAVDFPQYHFAITIPSNQIENALDWLTNKDGDYADGPSQPVKIWTDTETGAQIIRRDLFNAHSVYFSDPAGNVIELIARHDLDNSQSGPFNKSMLLNISAVSIVTKDIRNSIELLKNNFGVREVEGSTSGLKPVGGQTGFLELTFSGRIWEPTTTEQAFPYDMEVTVKHPQMLDDLLIPQSGTLIKTEL